MSRTDLDPVTIARSLRRMAGDGSIEWVMEPMQASVLLDVADMLDENAKLREELDQWHSLTAGIELPEYPVTQFKPKDLERENAELRELLRDMYYCSRQVGCDRCGYGYRRSCSVLDRMRELGIEVDE